MTTVYFAGSEDSDFNLFGSASVTTIGGQFRSAFARCGLQPPIPTSTSKVGLQAPNNFSSSDLWLSAIMVVGTLGNSTPILTFMDSSGIQRLQIQFDATLTSNAKVFTVNAAGTFTQIGSTFAHGLTNSMVAKLDVHVKYAVAGSFDFYVNGINVFSFTGDVTTNGVTALANFILQASQATGRYSWSEVICGDFDTRSLSLQTFAPVANGNTHNFDTGSPAAANVNETTLNDATLDGSTTAGQIDQYTNAAVATGTFDVIAFGVSARAQKGTSGPSKMDLNVRTGGADFFSADQVLTTTWANYQNWWLTNPNTGLAWLTSQIGSTAGFNIGLKSVT